MFTFRKPTDEQIRAHLARVADSPFTYQAVGCTRTAEADLDRGWTRDHERVLLGRGQEVFELGRQAIREWRMFPPTIATLCWRDCPLEIGRTVAVLYRAVPVQCWMLFPARIVFAIDGAQSENADGETQRFGFAYGTVADHPESGEERFLIEWNLATDEVWYDLLAVSRPAHWLARIGYPYTRYEQARFRRLSSAAMVQAVSSGVKHGHEALTQVRSY